MTRATKTFFYRYRLMVRAQSSIGHFLIFSNHLHLQLSSILLIDGFQLT